MSAEGEVVGKLAKVLEQVGVRDAEKLGEHEGEKVATKEGDKIATTEAGDVTAKINNPDDYLPKTPIDRSKPGGDLVPDNYDPYGGMSKDDFLKEHWDPDKVNDWDGSRGGWKYPGERYPGDPDKGGFVNGKYVEAKNLPVGYKIDRFGGPGGDYVSPTGVPFDQRALPPDSLNKPYHEYTLVKPFDDASGHPKYGDIAPAFGQPGGGKQLQLPHSVQWLLDHNYLR